MVPWYDRRAVYSWTPEIYFWADVDKAKARGKQGNQATWPQSNWPGYIQEHNFTVFFSIYVIQPAMHNNGLQKQGHSLACS